MSNPIQIVAEMPLEHDKRQFHLRHPSVNAVNFQAGEMETSVPARFETMARKFPHRIAFKTKNQALTYDELNKGANRVARALSDRRGNISEPVVLIMNQDADYVTAMLGALKAGKFCVHIDPSHPTAYWTSVLEDLQAQLILTNDTRGALDGQFSQKQRHLLLEVDDLMSSQAADNLELDIAGDSAANIFYTSGSTGEPKGVIQSHKYVVYKAFIDKLFITDEDRLVQVGKLSGEIFNILLNGAGFFSWNAKEHGFNGLADWLIDEKITTYRSIPSVFRYFCTQLDERVDLSPVRRIILGGEPVYRNDVELFKRYFSADCILINKYGGGEAGPISWFVVSRQSDFAGNIVPVGYAFPGKTILLYNHSASGSEEDSVGEIAIRSRYLSTGYWNKPDLTRSMFATVPEGADERVFFTGDLGSVDSDGCLTYRGRRDSRVKIRGHSVDLAEVEAALFEHKKVKEAVVITRSLEDDDNALIAYYVPIAGESTTSSDLRDFLKQKLPEYMLPSRYIGLEQFPRTATGKVDIRGLPLPDRARPEIQTPFIAPQSVFQQKIANLWSEVLGLDRVGIDDDFFDLGGHSLAATRVVARVLQEFRLQIPLQSLFESPTVAKMAEIIGRHKNNKLISENLEGILNDLESLSEKEAQRILLNSSGKGPEKGRHG